MAKWRIVECVVGYSEGIGKGFVPMLSLGNHTLKEALETFFGRHCYFQFAR